MPTLLLNPAPVLCLCRDCTPLDQLATVEQKRLAAHKARSGDAQGEWDAKFAGYPAHREHEFNSYVHDKRQFR